MSEIRVNNIIDEAGTGAPTFPNGASGNLTGNLTGNVTGNTSGTAGGLTGTPNIAVGTVGCSTVTSSGDVNGVNATFSGNLTVQGTTTTIDTAVTAVDSIAVDGAGTFGGTVRVNHTGNAASDQLVRLGNVNNSGTNSAHLFLANGYYVSPTDVDGTGAAAKILADGTIHDSIGPLRRLGIQGASGSFSLAAEHAGKLVISTGNGSSITIPQNVFSAGDMISVFNVSTGNNTIAQGTGATLYNTADGATGNRTLAAKGVCTIVCTSTNEFIISGSQVS
jgi:hypothetical protein